RRLTMPTTWSSAVVQTVRWRYFGSCSLYISLIQFSAPMGLPGISRRHMNVSVSLASHSANVSASLVSMARRKTRSPTISGLRIACLPARVERLVEQPVDAAAGPGQELAHARSLDHAGGLGGGDGRRLVGGHPDADHHHLRLVPEEGDEDPERRRPD